MTLSPCHGFCLTDRNLGVPTPQCAGFVKKGLLKGKAHELDSGKSLSRGVAGTIISGYQFLAEKPEGPQIARYQAIGIVNQLSEISPYAVEQFILLYQYNTEKKASVTTRSGYFSGP